MSQQIVPSRMNLQLYKQKIIAAKKGHELLKRKADALKAKFRVIMLELLANKKKMGEEFQDSLLLYAQAQYAAGDFQNNVKEAVKRATIRIEKAQENIAGVMLPVMSIRETEDSDNAMNQIGLDRGGQSIARCREKFKDSMMSIIKIATLQASFVILEEKIKVTNRRVNALEHVVIPKFQFIRQYIDQQLDELSKEDFFRLKKVLDNKRKIANQIENSEVNMAAISESLLDEDQDVIF